jgi:hypothetical protein
MGRQLIVYPVIIGMVYTLYRRFKKEDIIINNILMMKFLFIYIGIVIISLGIGLYSYPYYDAILNGPAGQVERIPRIISFLETFGITVDSKALLSVCMLGRPIKGLFLEIIYTFIFSYMVYCWYYDNWEQGFDILRYGVISSVSILLVYCCIEIPYLVGNETATTILKFINPYIHAVEEEGFWWPPLLWKGQLRSVFAEPSYFGIYAAFAMPIVWCQMVISSRLRKAVVLCMVIGFSFCVCLTQARTAIVLLLGEIILLTIFIVYIRNKYLLKQAILIYACVAISFIGSICFIPFEESQSFHLEKNGQSISVQTYMENNVGSLASGNERSNQARYAIMQSSLKIGMAHPVFGVGSSLRNAYIPDYLPDSGKNDHEVQIWVRNQKEKGIMKSGFPSLGEFTTRFAEIGIIGLIIFLLPAFVLLWKILAYIRARKHSFEEICPYVFFTISFLGMLAAGIGDSINIIYGYWILLGLGYAMCVKKKDESIDDQ